MKNIILIALMVLGITNCKAQIVPVEDFVTHSEELKYGAHVKDVNKVLDKYVGTWTGVYGGKDYEFKIDKYTEVYKDDNLRFDILLIRYKITDSSGTVIVNTMDLDDNNGFVLHGYELRKSGFYILRYDGLKSECGQNGNVVLSTISGAKKNKMDLILRVYGERDSDVCTTAGVEQVLPTKWIHLTKQ